MDKVLIRAKAREAKTFSSQAIEKLREGKYIEAHSLMSQAREAGRVCTQLIKSEKLEPVLAQFEQISHQQS